MFGGQEALDKPPAAHRMAGATSFIAIGDIISMYSDETDGFVCNVSSTHAFNGIRVEHKQGRTAPINVPDVQGIRFQICIQNRYKLNKKFRKYYAKSYSNQESTNLELRTQYESAKAAAAAENADNVAEQTRNSGRKLRYGEIIQLRHIFTGKYIHVNTTQTSQIDKNNMLLCLLEYNAKNAQFRVLPRYKVKSEGEYVQNLDQVVFESIKSQGHFIHQGALYQIDALSMASELNLGVEQSGFTIIKASNALASDDTYIYGGQLIQLFHKDLEAYLVAEGLFDSGITEGVHLRIRPVDQLNPRTLRPSSSAITYWQIESEASILIGEPLTWHQQLRFRHVCTRHYLCIDSDLNATLTPDSRDPRTVFKLHPVLQEAEEITNGGYARIEHMVTGSWVHAIKDKEYVRREFQHTKDAKSLSALRWDGGELRQLASSLDKKYDDAFTIVSISNDFVRTSNTAAGSVLFILNLIRERETKKRLNAKSAQRIIAALKELEEFMFAKGQVDKTRQKLLRNFRIVDLLVQLLKYPIKAVVDEMYMVKIAAQVYSILYTYMMGSSKKNSLYFAKYIDFFEEQLAQKMELSLNIAKMLSELIRDNRKIVDRIKPKQIDRFIELEKETEDYRFLDLLRVLCVCQNVAIADNQSYIATNWLQRDRRGYYLFERGQNIHKTPNVVYISTDRAKTWISLNAFVEQGGPFFSDEKYTFLLHQLDLYAALCYCRNSQCIRLITRDVGCLEWEEAFLCIKSTSLPDDIRAKFCNIIVDLFVDVGKNYSIIDTPQLAFVYDYIGTKEVIQLTTAEQYAAKDLVTLFPVVRDWIAEFMNGNRYMVAAEIAHNQLIAAVLRLLHYLIKFGYYEDFADIERLVPPLIDMLDGRHDLPFSRPRSDGELKESKKRTHEYRSRFRFETNQETKAIVDAKCAALDVLELILQFQMNGLLTAFVSKFKDCNEYLKTKKATNSSAPILAKALYTEFDATSTTRSSFRSQNQMLRELKRITDQALSINVQKLTDILIDLSHYRYDKIICKSLYILCKLYSSKQLLFKRATQSLILLTPDSCLLHREVSRMIPLLRLMAKLKWNDEHVTVVESILDELTSFCHLPKLPHEPHYMNQRILLCHDILNVIFEVISQETDQLAEQNSAIEIVYSKTLRLLQALLLDFPEVQMMVFERLDELLNVRVAETQLALTLKQVFHNNEELCLKIATKHISKLVTLCAEKKEKIPEYLEVFCSFAKVEGSGLAIKRNQTLVMKYIMQSYSKVAAILEKPRDYRLQLLIEKSDLRKLQYLLSLVDLLACCAEGDNRYIESLCQTLLQTDELLSILRLNSIDLHLKRPFLKYLTNAYMKTGTGYSTNVGVPPELEPSGTIKQSQSVMSMSTSAERSNKPEAIIPVESSMMQTSASELLHQPMLWEYFDTLIDELNMMANYIEQVEDAKSVYYMAIQPFPKRFAEHQNCDICYDHPSEFSTNYYLLKSIIRKKDKEAYVHSGLLYLFDGVFYFLQVFFTKFYVHDPCFPERQECVDLLTRTIIHLCEVLTPHLVQPNHLKAIIACLTYLVPKSTLSPAVMEDVVSHIGQGRTVEDRTALLKAGNKEYYGMEIGMNSKLKIFASNCAKLCSGHNTVQAQLKVKSNRPYTEMGGYEELPMGEEFQALVRCFVVSSARQNDQKYRIASKLIQQLAISSKVTTESKERSAVRSIAQEELDIRCLQILRAIIHNEERKLPEDWHMRTTDKAVKRTLKTITEIQNALNGYSISQEILPLLASPNDNLVREVLLLQAIMLFNANRTVQKSLLEYFTQTKEECFFYAVRNRFQLSAASIKERRLLVDQLKTRQYESREHAERLTVNLTLCKRALTHIRQFEIDQKLSDALKARTVSRAQASTSILKSSRSDLAAGPTQSTGELSQALSKDQISARRSSVFALFGSANTNRNSNGTNNAAEKHHTVVTVDVPNDSTAAPLIAKENNANMAASTSSNRKSRSDVSCEREKEKERDREGSKDKNKDKDKDKDKSAVEAINVLDEQLGLMTNEEERNEGDISLKDDGCVELVLKLVARMCEGQYGELQHYLREQPDNIKSYNIVAEVANYLSVLYANVNKDTIPLVIQLLITIYKLSVGNQANRETIYSCKTVDYINFMLRTGNFPQCTLSEILELMKRIANSLVALIEENSPEALQIARELVDTVDKEALLRIVTDCYVVACLLGKKKHVSTETFTSFWSKFTMHELLEHKATFLEVGFSFFCVLNRFWDLDAKMEFQMYKSLLTSLTPLDAYQELRLKALRHYRRHILSVEILKDDYLQKINFCARSRHVLREHVKETVKWNIDRSSPTNKIRDFMEWTKEIMEDIQYQRRVMTRPIALLTTTLWGVWNQGVILLSLIINVCLVVLPLPNSVNHTEWDNETLENPIDILSALPLPAGQLWPEEYWSSYFTLFVLFCAHNALSVFVLLTFFLANHPRPPDFHMFFYKLRRAFGRSNDALDAEINLALTRRSRKRLAVKLFSFTTLYYLIFFAASIGGQFVCAYLFAFHLLNVVNNNQLLQRVTKAVTKNGQSLIWVAILGLVMIYIFAIVGYVFYRPMFNEEKTHLYCNTIYQCFLSIGWYGLVGKLWDSMLPYGSHKSFMMVAFVAIFHLAFFILIILIGLNVIFGIIVDTFSELRDLKWQAESDMRESCFICSRSSHDFEHHGKGFFNHVHFEHNKWAYIFYFCHLMDTKQTDYTAIDMHVYRLWTEAKYDFFPSNRALCLSARDDYSTDSKVDDLLVKVDLLLHAHRREEMEKQKMVELQRQKRWQMKYAKTRKHATFSMGLYRDEDFDHGWNSMPQNAQLYSSEQHSPTCAPSTTIAKAGPIVSAAQSLPFTEKSLRSFESVSRRSSKSSDYAIDRGSHDNVHQAVLKEEVPSARNETESRSKSRSVEPTDADYSLTKGQRTDAQMPSVSGLTEDQSTRAKPSPPPQPDQSEDTDGAMTLDDASKHEKLQSETTSPLHMNVLTSSLSSALPSRGISTTFSTPGTMRADARFESSKQARTAEPTPHQTPFPPRADSFQASRQPRISPEKTEDRQGVPAAELATHGIAPTDSRITQYPSTDPLQFLDELDFMLAEQEGSEQQGTTSDAEHQPSEAQALSQTDNPDDAEPDSERDDEDIDLVKL